MAQDAHLGVFFAHPRAVVPDDHTLTAPVGYLYLYACSTSVQGVLREFLDHGGGAVYDLSGGDLLCYEGIEHCYLTTQEEETSAHVDYRDDSTRRIIADYVNCVRGLLGIPTPGE
jgi:hypothetical protein